MIRRTLLLSKEAMPTFMLALVPTTKTTTTTMVNLSVPSKLPSAQTYQLCQTPRIPSKCPYHDQDPTLQYHFHPWCTHFGPWRIGMEQSRRERISKIIRKEPEENSRGKKEKGRKKKMPHCVNLVLLT